MIQIFQRTTALHFQVKGKTIVNNNKPSPLKPAKALVAAAVLVAASLLSAQAASDQTYVNKQFVSIHGTPVNLQWSRTMAASTGHIMTVGNTATAGQGANVLLTKQATDGTVLWSVEYDGVDHFADYGISMAEDADGNFVVGATSYRVSTNSYDLVLIKYSAAGSLIWSYHFDAGLGGDDVAASVAVHGNEYVITGASEAANGTSNIITIRVDENGNELWTTQYDQNNLHDVAIKVDVDTSSGVSTVTGGSAASANSYGKVVLKYDASGSLIDEYHSPQTIGIDKPTSIGFDGNGNGLVGGYYTQSPGATEMVLVSLDDTLGLNWELTIDPTAGEDQITDIAVAYSGTSYIIGHTEESAGYFKCFVAKVNSAGTTEWERTYQYSEGSAMGQRITLDASGNINVAGIAFSSSDTNLLTLQYDSLGDLNFSQIHDEGGSEIATGILADLAGNIYVSATTSADSNGYVTVKYNTFTRNLAVVNDTVNEIKYIENEIIVRFDHALINPVASYDRGKTFGILSEFIPDSVVQEMNEVFEYAYDFGRFNTIKAFSRLTPNDTISISRLGDTVRVPEFWATLVIQIPETMDEVTAAAVLDTAVTPLIYYAELNYVGDLLGVPNDALFLNGDFRGFDDTIASPNNKADINMPEAWDQEVGNSDVRIGIYDTGINWAHSDLSITGSGSFEDSKVVDGWLIGNGAHIANGNTDFIAHGTIVSGIAAAIRNNSIGVSGVAGGDMDNGNSGASLVVIQEDGPTNAQEVGEWITYGALSNPEATEPGYGMHVQNHSWSWASDAHLIWEAVNFCASNAVVFVGASGNDDSTHRDFPASYKDEWVLKTGASNSSGAKADFSNYGNNLDFLAPGTADLYTGLSHLGNNNYTDTWSEGVANGTSFAAPHVSGVAALFQSYALNQGIHLFAPEDIEYFLQENAYDIDGLPGYDVGYDSLSGHGRIQADLALAAVKHPKYEVKHVSVDITVSAVLEDALETRYLARNYGSLNAGWYLVDIYRVTAVIGHSIGSKSMIDSWKRDGQSTLWGYTASTSDTLHPEPDISLDAVANNGVSATGYIYKFHLGSGMFTYAPVSLTGNAKFAYSLYLDDESINEVENVQRLTDKRFEVFPNPSADIQYIHIGNVENGELEVQLYDLNGRLVRNVYSGSVPVSKMISVDVSQLKGGVYVYQFSNAAKTEHIKTIITR